MTYYESPKGDACVSISSPASPILTTGAKVIGLKSIHFRPRLPAVRYQGERGGSESALILQ